MGQGNEAKRRARVVPRWNHLHGGDLQRSGQADLRSRCIAEGSSKAFQFEPRGRNTSRDRHSGGRETKCFGVQGAHKSRRRGESLAREKKIGSSSAARNNLILPHEPHLHSLDRSSDVSESPVSVEGDSKSMHRL